MELYTFIYWNFAVVYKDSFTSHKIQQWINIWIEELNFLTLVLTPVFWVANFSQNQRCTLMGFLDRLANKEGLTLRSLTFQVP